MIYTNSTLRMPRKTHVFLLKLTRDFVLARRQTKRKPRPACISPILFAFVEVVPCVGRDIGDGLGKGDRGSPQPFRPNPPKPQATVP